jgi:hypothetical protein
VAAFCGNQGGTAKSNFAPEAFVLLQGLFYCKKAHKESEKKHEKNHLLGYDAGGKREGAFL